MPCNIWLYDMVVMYSGFYPHALFNRVRNVSINSFLGTHVISFLQFSFV